MYKVNVNHYGSTLVNIESNQPLELVSLLILFLANRGQIEDENEEHEIADFCFEAMQERSFFRHGGFLLTFTSKV